MRRLRRCSTPLIRSKEGRIFCAKCKMYAVREGQAPPACGPPADPPAPASVGEEGGPRVANPAPRTPAAAAPSGQTLASVEAAEAAVVARLAAAAQALGGAAPRQEALQLLADVRECAAALREVLACKGTLRRQEKM